MCVKMKGFISFCIRHTPCTSKGDKEPIQQGQGDKDLPNWHLD